MTGEDIDAIPGIGEASHIAGILRLAAEDLDRLPVWRRWLLNRAAGRNWAYALRSWAALESREAFRAYLDAGPA